MPSGDTIFYRRRLPHIPPADATFFVICRLAGSLPSSVIAQLTGEQDLRRREIARPRDPAKKDLLLKAYEKLYFGKLDEWLDKASTGPRWLTENPIASLVSQRFHPLDGKLINLQCYCIMPNHMHIVLDVIRTSVRGEKIISSSNISNERTEVRATYHQYGLTRVLRLFKGSTARSANILLNRSGTF